jgi:alkylated DNA repair protein (DNA oxidative demethylase)
MKKIKPGVFLFEGALPLHDRKELARWYEEQKDLFYTPILKSGHKMNLTMCQFGMHWNAKDYKYYSYRSDVDDKPVTLVPGHIKDMVKNFCLEAFPYHNPDWDIMIANHYKVSNKLGMHADNSESSAALEIGHPVVSISIGASCIFKIGDPVHNVLLHNGDVLVFGGPARLDKHGVAKVYDEGWKLYETIGAPLDYGRLNITLRKF